MGTGKTTVGKELAARLRMSFIDTDELIESRHGPISRIFAEHGEMKFRQIEREVARELGAGTGLVIATGGRMVLDPESARSLCRNGEIFCLVASPETVHQRVVPAASGTERPLLEVDDPRQRIAELMNDRRDGYARFPQVSTDSLTPGQVADEIVRLWKDTVD
jgi:shikimate kinase